MIHKGCAPAAVFEPKMVMALSHIHQVYQIVRSYHELK